MSRPDALEWLVIILGVCNLIYGIVLLAYGWYLVAVIPFALGCVMVASIAASLGGRR